MKVFQLATTTYHAYVSGRINIKKKLILYVRQVKCAKPRFHCYGYGNHTLYRESCAMNDYDIRKMDNTAGVIVVVAAVAMNDTDGLAVEAPPL